MVDDPAVLCAIRASAWPALFDCSLRYYYQSILGLQTPSRTGSHLGTALHTGTAAFDAAALAGNPITPSDAADVFAAKLAENASDVIWDQPRKDAEHTGLRLMSRYCINIAPTMRYESVEVKCAGLDVATEYGVVRLTGTTDRVAIHDDGRRGIDDIKSGKRAVEGVKEGNPRAVVKGHHLQVGVYTIMAEHETKQPIDGPARIIGMQTSGNPHVALGTIGDVKGPLIGTPDEPGLIQLAAKIHKTGTFQPNPRSQLCSERYCGGWHRCKFHA